MSWALPGPQPITGRRLRASGIRFLIVVAGLLALCRLDLPIVQSFERLREEPGASAILSADALFRGFRAFAEIVVIVCVLVSVAALDQRRKLVLAHLVFALFLGWGFQAAGKGLIGRIRPNSYDGKTWAGMWLPAGPAIRSASDSSFPSGHSTVAFALGLTLAWFYPPLRPMFWVLAGGCAISRVVHGVHWPSDCWAGAWLGYAASWVSLRPHWFEPIIVWWHRRVMSRFQRERAK